MADSSALQSASFIKQPHTSSKDDAAALGTCDVDSDWDRASANYEPVLSSQDLPSRPSPPTPSDDDEDRVLDQ